MANALSRRLSHLVSIPSVGTATNIKEEKSKKMTLSKNFYRDVLELLKKGISPSHINENREEENSICSKLHITKQNLNYYLGNLLKLGIINKNGREWIVTKDLFYSQLKKELKKLSKKKSSIGMKIEKPTTNLHALEIKFPILEGKIPDTDWEVKNKLRNWLPKYKGLNNLGGLTLRNNNNKSLQVFVKARDIKNLEEVDNLCFKIRTFIHEYFKKKYNVILDVFECEVKNINLATYDKAGDETGLLRKGEKFELRFNKKSEKIFPKDDIDSKAWLDGSPFTFTAETNDKDWKREYLNMPFRMRQAVNMMLFMAKGYKGIREDLNFVAKNYASHVKLVKKASSVMDKLDKKLSRKNIKQNIDENQTSLHKFL